MSDMEYVWSPEEEVPWSRVVAAVPDEAAALEVVLARVKMSLAEFCRWRDGDFELGNESGDPTVEEWLEVAWDHLTHHFEGATGLRLYTYCRNHNQSGDPKTGFVIVGAWKRSPAGERFFGIKTQNKSHKG